MLTLHLLHHLQRFLQRRDNALSDLLSVLVHVLTSCSHELLRFLHNWLDLQDVEWAVECSRGVAVHLVQVPKRQVLLHVLQECRHERGRHDRTGTIHRVFEVVDVRNHVRQLILNRERTHWLTNRHRHVLECRVHVLHVLWVGQHFVYVG